MYTIVGFRRNEGKLENGKPWENFQLFCTKDDPTIDGQGVDIIKVSPKLIKDAFPDSSDVIGSKVDFAMEVRSYNGKQTVKTTSIIKY